MWTPLSTVRLGVAWFKVKSDDVAHTVTDNTEDSRPIGFLLANPPAESPVFTFFFLENLFNFCVSGSV